MAEFEGVRVKAWFTALAGVIGLLIVLLGGMFAYGAMQIAALEDRIGALQDEVARTGYALKDFAGVLEAQGDRLDFLVTGHRELESALETLNSGTAATQPAEPRAGTPRETNTHMSVIDEYRSRGGVE